MHAVLDGEATPGEARELERLLAADPAARAEFDDLQRLFDGLKAVPMAFPPEGLVSSVMADLPAQMPQRHRGLAESANFFRGPRVLGATGEIPRKPRVPIRGSRQRSIRSRSADHISGVSRT